MASIFSRIVAGEIPATKVYEDDLTLAFLDVSPASRGHTLVVPKVEYPDLLSMPADTLAATMASVQRVALAVNEALQPDGMNIVQNNGLAAGQTVFHYHVHIIPRWEGDHVLRPWNPLELGQDEQQAIAAKIRAAVQSE